MSETTRSRALIFEMLIICPLFFLMWQCPDTKIIAIKAFSKVYLNIKMSNFKLKYEYILAVFISICELNNADSNLKQVK